MGVSKTTEYEAGEKALARGEWSDARVAFEAALRAGESAEALEGLGTAAWWLDLADLVFDARERAYRLYLARKEHAAAARVAVWLAWDSSAFRGEHAVANGYFQRARRLLETCGDCAERAWLEVREGSFCLKEEGDPARALALAEEGIRVAQAAGSVDLEMLGRAVAAMAKVASGSVADGMRDLDEVSTAVISGEVKDRVTIGLCGCYLLAACERVRDYGRAVQWCRRIKAFCAKWKLRPLFAVCRTQYASICLWRGTWLEAEEELSAASEELAACRPGMRGDALVRLAELRRRQGRLKQAAALVEPVASTGAGLLVRARLALDGGDARGALELAEQYLRRVPALNLTDRASGLELAVIARADLQDWVGVKLALEELASIAETVGTVPLRADFDFASGYVAMGKGKAAEACRFFEEACELYEKSGAPFEEGRSRVQFARALGAFGKIAEATEELRRGEELLRELGAKLELKRVGKIRAALRSQKAEEKSAGKNGALTKREREVLRLVAEGLGNPAIAKKLFVSDHTVHRHLANILNKLDVPTRAAAVAQATRRGILA